MSNSIANFPIYLCKCWKSYEHNSESEYNIPFIARVELGIITGVVCDFGIPETDYKTKIFNKQFQKSPNFITPKVNIQYTKANDKEKYLNVENKFTRIVISNFGIVEDHEYNMTKPTDSFLNLHYIEKNSKINDIIKDEKIDELSKYIVSEGKRTDVNDIEISGDSFSVLIDGQLFGPFSKISYN